jgi:hypothetical protein
MALHNYDLGNNHHLRVSFTKSVIWCNSDCNLGQQSSHATALC